MSVVSAMCRFNLVYLRHDLSGRHGIFLRRFDAIRLCDVCINVHVACLDGVAHEQSTESLGHAPRWCIRAGISTNELVV